jgi:hypothetical protein
VSRTRGARIIRGTVGDGPEDVREDITGRVDIVYVVLSSEWWVQWIPVKMYWS